MLPLNEGAMGRAMQVADVKTKEYRQILDGLENHRWGNYLEDSQFKKWLKAELKRNKCLTKSLSRHGLRALRPAYPPIASRPGLKRAWAPNLTIRISAAAGVNSSLLT